MWLLILSLTSVDIDNRGVGSVTTHAMSSKSACYAAGRLYMEQHRRPYSTLRWSCTPL